MPKKDRSAANSSLCISLFPDEMEFMRAKSSQLHISYNAAARLMIEYIMTDKEELFLQWVEENVMFRGNRAIEGIRKNNFTISTEG